MNILCIWIAFIMKIIFDTLINEYKTIEAYWLETRDKIILYKLNIVRCNVNKNKLYFH